jgi:hypothetical protein
MSRHNRPFDWDGWLALQPWVSPFSAACWLDVSCRSLGGHPLLLGVLDGGEPVIGAALRTVEAGPLHVVRSSMLRSPIVIGAGRAPTRQTILEKLLDDVARRRIVTPPCTCTTDMVALCQAVRHHWSVTASWTVAPSPRTRMHEKEVSRGERKGLEKAQRTDVTGRVELADGDVHHDPVQATVSRQEQDVRLGKHQLGISVEAAGVHSIQTTVRRDRRDPSRAGSVMTHGARVAYSSWGSTSATGSTKCAAMARCVFLLKELQARGSEYFDRCGTNLPGVSDSRLKFGGTLPAHPAISRGQLRFAAAFPVYVPLSLHRRVSRRHQG